MLGWVVYSDHVLIRKKTKLRMIELFRRAGDKLDHCQELDRHDLGGIYSYLGSIKWFDSYNFKKKHIQPVLDKLAECQRWNVG